MPDKDGRKHAVVLSGGGANGAYEVGVLKALVAGKSNTMPGEALDPDIFLGTSVGSYNAAFLVSQWKAHGRAAVGNLEQIWLNTIHGNAVSGNGAFRLRGNIVDLFNPAHYSFTEPLKPLFQLTRDVTEVAWDGLQRAANLVSDQEAPVLERFVNLLNLSSFISNSPLFDLVHQTIRYEEFRSSEKELRIAATNWAVGRTDIFTQNDMSSTLGPQIIMASSAIPGIYPVHYVGSQPYVDGGVLLNTPLLPAIQAGADVLHVITLDPEVDKIPINTMSNTLTTSWRQQVISWVKAVDQNVREIWSLNRTLEVGELILQHLSGQKNVKIDMCYPPRDIPEAEYPEDGKVEFNINDGIWEEIKNYRPITVYVYRPQDDLDGPLGLLDFNQDRLRRLIDRGFNDAVHFIPTDQTFVPPYPVHRKSTAKFFEQRRMMQLQQNGQSDAAAL